MSVLLCHNLLIIALHFKYPLIYSGDLEMMGDAWMLQGYFLVLLSVMAFKGIGGLCFPCDCLGSEKC